MALYVNTEKWNVSKRQQNNKTKFIQFWLSTQAVESEKHGVNLWFSSLVVWLWLKRLAYLSWKFYIGKIEIYI